MPWRSSSVATSCACARSSANDTTPPRSCARPEDVHALDRAEPRQRVVDQRLPHARRSRRSRSPARNRSPPSGRCLPGSAACRPRTCAAPRPRWSARSVTDEIISPPPRNGGIASSSSRLAPQHADAGRAIQLVAGEGVEIAVQRLHIDRADAPPPARRRTAPCAPCACAIRTMRSAGVYGAQHVGHVGDRRPARPCRRPAAPRTRPCRARRHR